MSTEWYYARDGRQFGPVETSRLRFLATTGQISSDDLVWREGMQQWQPVSSMGELFPQRALQPAQPAGPAHPAPTPAVASQIGYFSASSGIGDRAAQALRGFATPTGPRDEWPLNDSHLVQLRYTGRQRKAMRGLSQLCWLLVAFCVFGVAGMIAMFASAPGGRAGPAGPNPLLIAGGVGIAVYMGLAALFYLCGRAALRARIWGPITVLVFLALGILSGIFNGMMMMNTMRDEAPGVIIIMMTVIFGGICIWVTIRGMLAIAKFRAAPVWCQEAIISAKL